MSDVGPNETCLYVTLLDQFGDGWSADVSFDCWSSVGGVLANFTYYFMLIVCNNNTVLCLCVIFVVVSTT